VLADGRTDSRAAPATHRAGARSPPAAGTCRTAARRAARAGDRVWRPADRTDAAVRDRTAGSRHPGAGGETESSSPTSGPNARPRPRRRTRWCRRGSHPGRPLQSPARGSAARSARARAVRRGRGGVDPTSPRAPSSRTTSDGTASRPAADRTSTSSSPVRICTVCPRALSAVRAGTSGNTCPAAPGANARNLAIRVAPPMLSGSRRCDNDGH
jgi:hypothetical protein